MPTWEHFATSWAFRGQASDLWPGRDKVLAAGPDILAEAERAEPEYYAWQDAQENEYLRQMGEAGFELVTVHREVDHSLAVDQVSVRAYFKRQAGAEQSQANPIGFRPPGT